jgi:hypothetical protein
VKSAIDTRGRHCMMIVLLCGCGLLAFADIEALRLTFASGILLAAGYRLAEGL